MTICCICRFVIRNGPNIFETQIGDPPKLISDLVLICIQEESSLQLEKDGRICRKCSNKMTRYYEATLLVQQIKQEVIQLMMQFSDHEKYETKHIVVDNTDVSIKLEAETDEYSMKDPLIDPLIEPVNLELIKFECESFNTDVDPIVNKQEDSTLDKKCPLLTAECSEETSLIENTLDKYKQDNPGHKIHDDQKNKTNSRIDKNKEQPLVNCTHCDKTFPNRRKFRDHFEKEHSSGYVCDQCGKTLASFTSFYIHRAKHSEVKKFECSQCPARFHLKSGLKLHMACHSKDTNFHCELCPKRFVYRSGLNQHMQIHEDKPRRYECKICEFKFRCNGHLQRHMAKHTGLKPYSCTVCGKTFSQNYNMNVHMKEHEQPGSTRQCRYRCKRCPKTFTNVQNFRDHCERNNCVEKNIVKLQ